MSSVPKQIQQNDSTTSECDSLGPSDVDKESSSVCIQSDYFSETASEFYEQSETDEVSAGSEPTPAKRRKRGAPDLARRRKGLKRKDPTCSGDTEKNIDVDVESRETSQEEISTMLGENESTASSSDLAFADAAEQLSSNLKLLLPTIWIVDVRRTSIVRLVQLNDSKNASVAASIFWGTRTGSFGVFVHENLVPPSNKIYLSKTIPVKENLGSVADYLSQLAANVSSQNICTGVTAYKEMWHQFPGFVDSSASQDGECYRSAQCLLLVGTENAACHDCSVDSDKMKRLSERKKADPTSHINDDYLTREELKDRKDHYKGLYRSEKKRGDRLQERVDNLKIKLDEALRDDLLAILRANEHKMTEIQRIFWQSQKDALCAKDKRGFRWHPMMIRVALRLHSYSDGALQFLNDSTIMVLPTPRTLYDYSHFIEPKEGCQEEIIKKVQEKINKCGTEDHLSFVNLMFDEMNIRCGLVTKKSTGELIGYTNYTDVDRDLEELQAQLENRTYKPTLAKKVLVYLAQGITSNVKDVVALYSTYDLSATQLFDRTWEVVYCLEEAGIKVLSLTCDGAATNRKFFKMHRSYYSDSPEVYCTKNLASGDSRPLFFIVDPPHLLKAVRNAFANSFSHRKTRKLWKNGEFLSWQVIEKLYELTKNDKWRTHKLTKAHVKLSSFSCMTVKFATQVFSDSVAKSIQDIADHEDMKKLDTNELVIFIQLMNRFFDCVNGKEREGEVKDNRDLAAFTGSADPRIDFLQKDFLGYFEEWKQVVKNRPGIISDTERAKMIISYQALEAVQITVHSITKAIQYMLTTANAPKVNARLFNQDSLEQYFGMVRRKHGDDKHPYLKTFQDDVLNISAQGTVAMPTAKGNTEVSRKKGIEVDDTLLPKRKAKRN
ncbi:Transposable element P transposase [Frankliniella fusca]|uniref:Transposable element P transposase n=1 Tax=Frankliniella fusca TaxID=407009 RepID=A0AAE1I3D5_9NEOP|nr:Transposable element P transposase [Frankliniella fusca]